MGQHTNFVQGSRAEFLAQFALSRFGFITAVPRQSDQFKADQFLHLAQWGTGEDGIEYLNPKGPTLAFQIKTSKADFTF